MEEESQEEEEQDQELDGISVNVNADEQEQEYIKNLHQTEIPKKLETMPSEAVENDEWS